MRECRQVRSIPSAFQTREENEDVYIEGYFAVFNTDYELWPGATESVAPGAFADTLGNDVRALVDHESRLVLGRCRAGTLELREDSHGLWGRVRINRADSDAMNLYERVRRGDVDQCSFGFDITAEDTDYRDDGSVHWTIRSVDLREVSVVTFPAYEATSVSARKKDYAEIRKRQTQVWREAMRKKVEGVKANGVESADAE